MSKQTFARVTITLPQALLDAADRLAAAHARSRSWIVADAIRRMVEAESYTAEADRPGTSEPAEVTEARLRRLRQAESLTPERRLLASEELVRLGRMVRPQRWRRQITAFDSYEEYHLWKTASRAGA